MLNLSSTKSSSANSSPQQSLPKLNLLPELSNNIFGQLLANAIKFAGHIRHEPLFTGSHSKITFKRAPIVSERIGITTTAVNSTNAAGHMGTLEGWLMMLLNLTAALVKSIFGSW